MVRTTLAVLVTLAVVVGAYLLMWQGWRRRARRHVDFPPLPAPLPDADPSTDPVAALYLGTTTSGDWLDRVVAHGLGEHGEAVVTVTAAGVVVDRQPQPALHVPTASLRAVRGDRAGAGRAVRRAEYVILTWAHDNWVLDTAIRPRRRDDLPRLVRALEPMTNEGVTP